ncbi:MAG: hypothetical protein M0R46_14165 [Candidatus Muirbacterium halophilum]|nr:hypothetical protein [Candidatus Muirbacterium halophilum]
MNKEFLDLSDFVLNNKKLKKLLDKNTISKLIKDLYDKIYINTPNFDGDKLKITLFTFMFTKEDYVNCVIHDIRKTSNKDIQLLNNNYINNLINTISNMDENIIDQRLKQILINDKRNEQLKKLL